MLTGELISVIIIEYKNHKYLKEAVDSVLMQDYNNIELIISDDASGDFNPEMIQNYINQQNRGNIRKLLININETNLGTVKHLNKIIPMTTGEYITIFAADDAMFDEHTVSNIVHSFHTLNENEDVITCQLGMYDETLQEYMHSYISEANIQKIRSYSPQQIYKELAQCVLFPAAGTCFRRGVFEKYGYFDEQYTLVEDWTYAAQLSKLGVKIHYFDFVGYKHRDGGVSHGNKDGVSKSVELFVRDCLKLYENLYFSNLKIFNSTEKIRLFRNYVLLMDKLPMDSRIRRENNVRSVVYELVQIINYYGKRSAPVTSKPLAKVAKTNRCQMLKNRLLRKFARSKKFKDSQHNIEANDHLISIVVISYNSEKTVRETLDSILLQNYGKLELIVADDASSDQTVAIVKKWLGQYGSRFIHAELIIADTNGGTVKNCNSGFKKCSGKYIKLIAADDILKENCITDMVKGMEAKDADIGFCYEYVFFPEDKKILFTEKENLLEKRPNDISIFSLPASEMYKKLLKGNVFPAPTSMIKRSTFEELGGFDENYPYTEDYPFWLKALKNGAKVTFIKSVGVYYRKDKQSISWRENAKPTKSQLKFQECLDRFLKEVRNPELERLGIPYSNAPIRPDAHSISYAANRKQSSRWNQKVLQFYNKLLNRNVPKLIRLPILLLAPKVFYEKWESKLLQINDKLTRHGISKYLRFFLLILAPRYLYKKSRAEIKKYIYSCENKTDKIVAKIIYKGYIFKTAKPMIEDSNSNKHWFSDYIQSLKYEAKYKQHKSSPKTRVVFAVHFLFSFSALETIYYAMMKNNHFDPIILLMPTTQPGIDKQMYYENGLIEEIEKKGMKYHLAYENGRWKNILMFEPDFVFFQTPYYGQRHPMYNANLALSYPKIIYTPYGPWIMDKSVKEYIDCGIDKPYFNNLWRFFADKLTIELLEYAAPEYLNITVESGSPKVDFHAVELVNKNYCWKNMDDQSRKKIIWLPRWGIKDDRTSFLDYYEYFLELIDKNDKIDFVMRPHPFLFKDLVRSGAFKKHQLESMISAFDEADNSAIDYHCDYREGLVSCDFIVADFTSIIYEYLPSGKPIIYTKKDNTLVDKRIMDSCYVVSNLQELQATINMLLSGKDELKEQRLSLIKDLNYFPHAPKTNGEYIAQYILEHKEK